MTATSTAWVPHGNSRGHPGLSGKDLFYQRSNTSKSLAEEPLAWGACMDDLKARRTAKVASVPLPAPPAASQSASSPSPQPQSSQSWGGDRFSGTFGLATTALSWGLWGKSELQWQDFGCYSKSLPLLRGAGIQYSTFVVSLSLLEITGRTCLPNYIYPDSYSEHSKPGSQMQRQHVIRDKAKK